MMFVGARFIVMLLGYFRWLLGCC